MLEINGYKIEVGKKYRIEGRNHMWSTPVLHILAIIEDHIVYKRYNKIKQFWRYEIESFYVFESFIEDNQIREVK